MLFGLAANLVLKEDLACHTVTLRLRLLLLLKLEVRSWLLLLLLVLYLTLVMRIGRLEPLGWYHNGW